jgi:hypothetical protein
MQNSIDAEWDGVGFGGNSLSSKGPDLASWRWSFAWLPDEKMKAVAAGWMVRVLLGADPAEISEEELQVLAIGALMTTERHGAGKGGPLCDA